MIGIGDKVVRTFGINSGMKRGDRGTVISIKELNGVKYAKIKEYSNGWHDLAYLKRIPTEVKIESCEIKPTVNLDKVAETLSRLIKGEDSKRNEESKLDRLKKQREELDKKIKELEETETVLDDKYIKEIWKQDKENLVQVKFYQKGRTITCRIHNPITNKVLGKGTSVAMECDTFDIKVGCRLAYHRAMMSYNKRIVNKIVRDTY